MKKNAPHVCFAGSMLGKNAGYITTQGQIVADLLAADDYEITCVSARINRAARLAEIAAALIKNHRRFDIVVLEVYSGLSFLIAELVSALCRWFKIPLVMVLHGGNLPEFAEKHPRRTKRVLSRADFLVAPSAFLAEKFNARGFAVRVIPNVLDLEKYPFRERSKIAPKMIWMRSFHAHYHPEMALTVLAELRKSFPAARLVMAGKDKGLEPEIKKAAANKGLSEAVRFAGFLDERKKIKEFSEADIYINTNRIDNMPVSVLEACAHGLPVVATNVGGLPYLIADGENGLLCADGNADAMAEAVKRLLGEPELTRRISQNGRKLAERSAWQSVKAEWEKLFEEILSLKPQISANEFSENNLKIKKAGLQ